MAARGALFAGARGRRAAARSPRAAGSPTSTRVDWDGVALLWLNFPNNPTAATASLELYERAAALAREHDFVLASDEAYSELWFEGEPPRQRAAARRPHERARPQHALQALVDARLSLGLRRRRSRDRSPRSSATARTSASRRRPSSSARPRRRGATRTTSIEVRERYRAKRDALLPALLAAGLEPSGGDASFFLWLRVPGGEDAEAYALRLLDEHGIVVAPGPYFGPGGEGHVRIALVPTLEDCRRAAELLA